MKATVTTDGTTLLDGTPEELAEYLRARFPAPTFSTFPGRVDLLPPMPKWEPLPLTSLPLTFTTGQPIPLPITITVPNPTGPCACALCTAVPPKSWGIGDPSGL